MRWYHWIGLVALAVVLGIVWFLTAGRGPNPAEKIRKELEAIDAKNAVKRLQTKVNTERALAYVDTVYEAELAAMDAARKARAGELRHDPAKLAAFIIRGP
jgi:hypothetical protein